MTPKKRGFNSLRLPDKWYIKAILQGFLQQLIFQPASSRIRLSSKPSKMSRSGGYGGNQCYASCPASTVTIQPPPFVLNIPGPALYCPDQPFRIEQFNPCAGRGVRGGNALYASGGSNFSEFYTPALPSNNFNYSTY
ncbi:uncharacterized protein li-ac-35 [Anolis carolinensis]|uniref:Keratin n=2 Tax=Anolis carolinensis TaxID=28377 RepID=A0A803U1H9_ANOCA|nr:PREDICTED: uncharacterized protein li-ac-35 [Anolis carolinensis]|eukprot:XP_003226399.2 PREDICTED: uncharacterized protein li-ac-35 [Anolis carolinensis]